MAQAHRHALLRITGRPPGLVMHNGVLADDTNEFAQGIAELVEAGRGRKKLTDEQRERKELLCWRGALYLDATMRPYLPGNNLFKCIVTAARELNLGTKIEDRGAVTIEQSELPIRYDGPEDITKLWNDTRFRFRTCVNPNPSSRTKGLIPLVRPVFPAWSIETTARLLTEMINWEQFEKVMELAGNVGVGNARKIGYGRFDVKVVELKEEKK